MSSDWPTMKARKLLKIIEQVCGPPIRQRGSHRQYRRPDGVRVTFGHHDGDEIDSGLVPDILVDQLGLTVEQAQYAARKGRLPR